MSLTDLIATINRFSEITRLIETARKLPDRYSGEANRIRLDVHDVTYSERDAMVKLGSKAVHIVIAQERQRGETERAELLLKYAAELESLRAVIPQLAAKSAIEIGAMARSLKEEVA
jgi:hypothetical protein